MLALVSVQAALGDALTLAPRLNVWNAVCAPPQAQDVLEPADLRAPREYPEHRDRSVDVYWRRGCCTDEGIPLTALGRGIVVLPSVHSYVCTH